MYVKITNGSLDTYPYNVGQLRRDNKNTSFPKQIPDDMLESYGILPVTFADMPSINDRTQKTEQASEPSLVDGKWTINWTTTDKTTEEIAEHDADTATQNRAARDSKLAKTDWHGMSDVTMSSEMTTYRQALRDLPAHENWPNLEDADWPTAP
jgi:hypothetical protein